MMSENMFMRSICAPLALVYGVGGVVGSCTSDAKNVKKVTSGRGSAAEVSVSSPSKGDLKEGSVDLGYVGGRDVVGGGNFKTATADSGKTKDNGSVDTEEGSTACENGSLTSDDKDKIIKMLLNQQSTRGEQTIGTKSKKKSEVAADYLQKFGSIGALMYALYGAFGIWRGDFNIKDVATTANAIFGASAFGAAAMLKF